MYVEIFIYIYIYLCIFIYVYLYMDMNLCIFIYDPTRSDWLVLDLSTWGKHREDAKKTGPPMIQHKEVKLPILYEVELMLNSG